MPSKPDQNAADGNANTLIQQSHSLRFGGQQNIGLWQQPGINLIESWPILQRVAPNDVGYSQEAPPPQFFFQQRAVTFRVTARYGKRVSCL